MTDDEWADIALMLRHWWPGEFSDAGSRSYRMLLDQYPASDVAGAVGRLLDKATQQPEPRFRPSAVDVLAEVRGRGETITHSPDEAWALLEQAAHKFGISIYDPSFNKRHQAAIDWLADQDPVVAAFAARRGLFQIEGSLMQEHVNDPDHGGAVRGRIAKEYREHVEDCADRVARGLPAVEPHMLVVRTTGGDNGGGMAEVLERLRPEEIAGELEPGE